MEAVNIGELKDQLSGHLQYVRNGRRSSSAPQRSCRSILPFRHDPGWEREAQLVASGAMKMPEEEMDWERFFGHRQTAAVSDETAVQAAIDSD